MSMRASGECVRAHVPLVTSYTFCLCASCCVYLAIAVTDEGDYMFIGYGNLISVTLFGLLSVLRHWTSLSSSLNFLFFRH